MDRGLLRRPRCRTGPAQGVRLRGLGSPLRHRGPLVAHTARRRRAGAAVRGRRGPARASDREPSPAQRGPRRLAARTQDHHGRDARGLSRPGHHHRPRCRPTTKQAASRTPLRRCCPSRTAPSASSWSRTTAPMRPRKSRPRSESRSSGPWATRGRRPALSTRPSDELLPRQGENDLVMVMDADTTLDAGFLEAAVRRMTDDRALMDDRWPVLRRAGQGAAGPVPAERVHALRARDQAQARTGPRPDRHRFAVPAARPSHGG